MRLNSDVDWSLFQDDRGAWKLSKSDGSKAVLCKTMMFSKDVELKGKSMAETKPDKASGAPLKGVASGSAPLPGMTLAPGFLAEKHIVLFFHGLSLFVFCFCGK